MNTLTLSIAVLKGCALILAQTPSAGSYYVESSSDGCSWRVIASGYTSEPMHVVAAADDCTATVKLYRVEWREIGK